MNIYTCDYISTNCNQTPTVVDWGNNDLICYGSCNAIYVYDKKLGSGGKVKDTLVAHTDRINSVRWIRDSSRSYETEIVSGSSDFNVIVWTKSENEKYIPQILKGHEGNVNLVDGLHKSDQKETLVVSGSMDSSIRIWLRKTAASEFECIQIINLGYHISVALRLSFLDESGKLILASGLDNSSISLFIEENDLDKVSHFTSSSVLKAHEDWVRGLDFTTDGDDLLLASCSQDALIRLWRFKKINKSIENDYKTHGNIIVTEKANYRVYVESVLVGHEQWIYSVNWNPNNHTLISASLDKTMVIWEYDRENKLWIDKVRVGEVGGNTLGFYGGFFGPNGTNILGHSYHGAFHIWQNENNSWKPIVTVGGHFREVVDLSWEPENGSYLFTVSADQTCRIHGPWKTNEIFATWHEIARPQIHGYDMNSIAVFSKNKYASSSEEKVIRLFEAPSNFIDNMKRICQNDVSLNSEDSKLHPKGASVPSLGLSNKAVYFNDNAEISQKSNNKNMYPEESQFTSTLLTEPPTEETLLQNTLWPETQKLYGHGYEVFTLAASPDGNYLASACKATTSEHAAVLLWDKDGKQIQKLISHTLTVVQISFSPDSKHILTVSRDRRWSLFSKYNDVYELTATVDKKTSIHARIIWCCAWTHDSEHFATGSRDGKLVVWKKNDITDTNLTKKYILAANLTLNNDSITALTIAPKTHKNYYILAIGLDTGFVHFYKWRLDFPLEKIITFDQSVAHHLTVKKLQFRPLDNEHQHKDDQNMFQIASCSSDFSVKVFSIYLK